MRTFGCPSVVQGIVSDLQLEGYREVQLLYRIPELGPYDRFSGPPVGGRNRYRDKGAEGGIWIGSSEREGGGGPGIRYG